jgi:cytoplasmic iron level regulating protein YaaA (DUF328/UPF0246 family)
MPPSQKKASGGRRAQHKGAFDEALDVPRRRVRDALATFIANASTRELETTLQARGPLLAQALGATNDCLSEHAQLMPSWHRYQGVVWIHLDPGSLSPAQRRQIMVPSALYGLNSGDDFIADYRLKMNVGLSPLGSLARFWKPHLTSLLAQGPKNVTIVNFLPQEHAASLDFASLSKSHRVVHVHFVASDESRAVGHDAKAVKGVVARRIVTDGLSALDEMTWRDWHVRRVGSDVVATAPARDHPCPERPPS